MEKQVFLNNLLEANSVALEFTRPIVNQELPQISKVLLIPNCSYDGNPLEDDEEVFPNDSIPEGKVIGPLTLEEATNRLWRNGKVPEWVNIRVYDCDDSFSYLLLESCGRFTGMSKHLYHKNEGYPPFHVQSPYLPHNWESVESDGKFDLEGKRKTSS